MNSSYYQQSELSLIKEAHNLNQQSSESRKIRGEADAISTQRPFSKFEFSHLFLRCWSVLVSPTPGEQNRWHLFSIWTAITSRNYRCIQANKFYLIVARSQRLISCPNELRTRKFINVRFQHFIHIFYFKYSRRNTFCRSRQNQAIQLWLHFQYFNSHLFYRRNRSLVKSTSGLARSHSRFSFEHGSRILQSLLTKNQSAIC